MTINRLSELLGRFKNVGLSQRLSKNALIEEVNVILGQGTISQKDITIKGKTAFVRLGSVIKNEIAIYKDKILSQAKEKIGSSFTINDIH